MPRKITPEILTVKHNGKPLEILLVHGSYSDEHGVPISQCFLCGFKPRKGEHSYWVHKAIGGWAESTPNCQQLLPFFDDDGNDLSDDLDISQGWFEVGSECQKQLPERFVRKRKKGEI